MNIIVEEMLVPRRKSFLTMKFGVHLVTDFTVALSCFWIIIHNIGILSDAGFHALHFCLYALWHSGDPANVPLELLLLLILINCAVVHCELFGPPRKRSPWYGFF